MMFSCIFYSQIISFIISLLDFNNCYVFLTFFSFVWMVWISVLSLYGIGFGSVKQKKREQHVSSNKNMKQVLKQKLLKTTVSISY